MTLLSQELQRIKKKVQENERLSAEDGIALYRSPDLLAIGELANRKREALNGNTAFYIVNLHINYSNICVNRCRFCAFGKDPDDPEAYTMTVDQIVERARTTLPRGATEIHIVGGLHPTLTFDYYLEMLAALKRLYPHVHLQAFTAVETAHMAARAGLSLKETLEQLRQAGLGSIPGGGAEIFDERVRREMCPRKLPADQWLEVMHTAHEMGIRSNATMLYGHTETIEERIDHLCRLREVQDRTRGFMAFIPLAFHSQHTEFAHLPPTTGYLDLKTFAVSRLMLDNFMHLKAFWIMLSLKLAQVSLSFGVDDLDGTVVQEQITHAAGAETPQQLSVDEITALITEAGRTPVERDTLYNPVSKG
jgi:aminodeoxyfutalosine synthase